MHTSIDPGRTIRNAAVFVAVLPLSFGRTVRKLFLAECEEHDYGIIKLPTQQGFGKFERAIADAWDDASRLELPDSKDVPSPLETSDLR
jgi:hypothetical protein